MYCAAYGIVHTYINIKAKQKRITWNACVINRKSRVTCMLFTFFINTTFSCTYYCYYLKFICSSHFFLSISSVVVVVLYFILIFSTCIKCIQIVLRRCHCNYFRILRALASSFRTFQFRACDCEIAEIGQLSFIRFGSHKCVCQMKFVPKEELNDMSAVREMNLLWNN